MAEKPTPNPPPAAAATMPDPTTHVLMMDDIAAEKGLVAQTALDDPVDSPATKKKPKAGLGNYFRVFTFGTRLDALLMALSIAASLGSGIAMPLMNIVFGKLVDTFTNYFIPGSSVTKQQFQAGVNQNALYIFIIFLAKFSLSYISMITVRISGLRISAAFRLAYLRATFAQPVSIVDTVSPGVVSTRITTSSNTVQLGISQSITMAFQALAFTIGLYVVAFIKSWLLTLVASACLPLILVVYGVILRPFMAVHKVTEELHDDASALSYEIFSSIRIVVAFGAEDKLAKQHEDFLEKAAKNDQRVAWVLGMMMAPAMSAMYATFGLAFWFGVRQYSRGHVSSVGDITVVLFSVMMAVMNVGRLIGPIVNMAKAATAATELFATLDAPVPSMTGLRDPEVSADLDVAFDNVSFSYPSRPNVQILDGFNARFEAGKVTAIVGPSGSGKSTLVALVQRWYDLLGTTARIVTTDKTEDSAPADELAKKSKNKKDKKAGKDDKKVDVDLGPHTCTGSIRMGSVDLRDVDLKWWRSQIGLVSQEPFLFNDTLFNNVAYGLCGTRWHEASKEEKLILVKAACKEACADEFIDRLPEGYETLVGESGIKLSGGQRQRIAIARSIVKQPPILILDEATSAIDVRTERIVQEALDRVSKNRTTIVIAHRLSTIRRADKILVMRQGKLVEEGTHESLLEDDDGVYYGLVHAQNLIMETGDGDAEVAALHKTQTSESESSKVVHNFENRDAEPKFEMKSFLRSGGLLVHEQRRHWVLYSLAIMGILAAGAVYPIQAYVFANIINVFTMTGDAFVKHGYFWAGMFGLEALGVFIAYFAVGFCTHRISIAITRNYRQEYLENIIRKRIAYYDAEGNSAGSLTSRVSGDAEQLQQLMSTEMSMASIAIVNLIGSTIIAFVYGWKLSLVGLFCALPPILVAGMLRLSLEMKFEQMNAAVFADSSQFATEAVGAFRTVLSLIMEDMIGDRYQALLGHHVKRAFSSAKYGTLVFAASDSVDMACMALTFWYGGTLLAAREYGLIDFFVVYMAIVQSAVAAGTWFAMAPNISQATAAANRIISVRPDTKKPAPVYVPIQDPSDAVGIEFRNVNFAYKTRAVPVLSNLNINIKPGQFAALVGASGCGKSTSISLLERFYDADSGAVLYNGQDITTLDPTLYRRNISLVSQEPTLYEGTIRENVALSVESALDADIERACKDAQIHDFITSLPLGYATRLGPKGMSLSGGQKQRVSLARALLRDPKVLLLDEATSSLDSESEKLVQQAIERAARGSGEGESKTEGQKRRTVIAVAHRLATVQGADVIFVLGNGRVLESGSHAELLRRRGMYWQMCQAQALDR